MKLFNQLVGCLVAGALALALGACSKDKYEEPNSSFKVVKTEFASGAEGGEGYIELTEGGFEVSVDDAWVKAEKSGDKKVKLVIERNTQPDSRATNVRLTKGNDRLAVPITQLGEVNALDKIGNKEFSRKGGTMEIDLSGLTQEPKIEFESEVDWVTQVREDGKLILVISPNPNMSPARSVRVNITAGLANQSFVVSQLRGLDPTQDLLPEHLPGTYQMTYVERAGAAPKTMDVYIFASNVPNRYIFVGLALNVVIDFDPDLLELKFVTGPTALPPDNAKEGQEFLLLAFNGSNVSAGDAYHFKGVWDKQSTTAAKFAFTPGDNTLPLLALVLRDTDGSLKLIGGNGPSVIGSVTIVRKGDLPAAPANP